MKRLLLLALIALLVLASCKQAEPESQGTANSTLMIQDACIVDGEPVILEMGYDSLVWLWYIYMRQDGVVVGVSAYADGVVRNRAYLYQGVCRQ